MTAPDLSRAVWRKSSYSSSESNCVEVAWLDQVAWRKSSFSSNDGNCVEVAWLGVPVTAVRDSKNADGPALTVPRSAWDRFLRATR